MEYRWYAIQTTAGHENKVRGLLQRRIEEDPRPADTKLIRQALVPVQEVIEIKNGKKVNVERKLYPGYVLVEMGMRQEALHVVNSIQGVIKFVGTGEKLENFAPFDAPAFVDALFQPCLLYSSPIQPDS